MYLFSYLLVLLVRKTESDNEKINTILTIVESSEKKSYDSSGEQEHCNHTCRHDTFVCQHKVFR